MNTVLPTPTEAIVLDWLRLSIQTTPRLVAPSVWQFEQTAALGQMPLRSNAAAQITLVCDPAQLALNPGAELINSDHPLLEYMLDGLERHGNVHVVESWMTPVTEDPEGHITIPGTRIDGAFEAQVTTSWESAVVLSWQVHYKTDAPISAVLRFAIDPGSGKELPQLLPKLNIAALRDGRPPGIEQGALETALEAGVRLAESRVREDLALISGEIETRMNGDRLRIERHLTAELSALHPNDTEGRARCEAAARREIEDLSQKYSCSAHLGLRNALWVWIPRLKWDLRILGKRPFRANGFEWSLEGGLRRPHCPECLSPSLFLVCASGEHLLCACRKTLKECAECHDPGCDKHLSACGSCARTVCQKDRNRCEYGQHIGEFCKSCLRLSADGRPICGACAEQCQSCNRLFDAPRMAVCRGGEDICVTGTNQSCGLPCQQCHHAVCAKHGIMTAENTRVCLDHAAQSDCCQTTWAQTRTVCCTVGGERLCPKHMNRCQNCGQPVCEGHSEPARNRGDSRVCLKCLRRCVGCPPKHAWIPADVQACATCGREVCSDHRLVCIACSQVHCREHLEAISDGTLICERDREECGHCAAPRHLHRRPLVKCAICGTGTCASHLVTCAVCDRQQYGSTHELPVCLGCGRASCETNGCSPNGAICAGCKDGYCVKCGTEMRRRRPRRTEFGVPGPLCALCVQLTPAAPDSSYIQWLRRIHSHLAPPERELLGMMLKQQKYIRIFARAHGARHKGIVCALRAIRPFWALLTPSISDRTLWIRYNAEDGTVLAHVVPFQSK